MSNAKSFANRHKDFRLDNLLPHEEKCYSANGRKTFLTSTNFIYGNGVSLRILRTFFAIYQFQKYFKIL